MKDEPIEVQVGTVFIDLTAQLSANIKYLGKDDKAESPTKHCRLELSIEKANQFSKELDRLIDKYK